MGDNALTQFYGSERLLQVGCRHKQSRRREQTVACCCAGRIAAHIVRAVAFRHASRSQDLEETVRGEELLDMHQAAETPSGRSAQ